MPETQHPELHREDTQLDGDEQDCGSAEGEAPEPVAAGCRAWCGGCWGCAQ